MIHRYSPQGIDQISRKTFNQGLTTTSASLLAGFAIIAIANGLRQSLQLFPLLVVFGILFFWMQRRSVGKIRDLAESTEIELAGDVLKGRNSLVTITIRRQDVVELRSLRDGILVREKDLRQSLHLKPELERFDELVRRIEEWAPVDVARTRSPVSLSFGIVALVLANLGLMVTAFSAGNPAIALTACIAEAAFLLFCLAWVWRSSAVAPKLKRLMLMALLPVFSLLGRAYLLLNQR